MPLPALIGVLIFGLTGYFIGEAALGSFAHPVHWLVAVVGAALAYAAGLIWHRTRGYN